MKIDARNEISVLQFAFMIHGAQLGVGLLSLPKELAKTAGTDGWISLLIGWVIAVICSLVIIQVMAKHPGTTVFDLLYRYFGKALGMLLGALLSLYFYFTFFTSFFASVHVYNEELLPRTPTYLIVLLFAFPVYTIARHKLRVLGRYAELLFWGFLWLVLLYLYPLRDAEWKNLLPVLKEGWFPVFGAVKTTVFSFLGFETAFILYPLLSNKKAAVKGVLLGNTLTMIVYMIVIMVCSTFFSPDDITSYNLPTLKVIKIIEFRFLERIEIIVLIGYLYMLSRVWIFYLYSAVYSTSRLFGMDDHRPFLRVFLACIIVFSLFYAPTLERVDHLKKLLNELGIYISFAFPVCLLAYTKLVGVIRRGN
ncbi:endospore germination permease [Paenibacillus allorhizosphaerae]|uniref:Spore germination protein YndE n=1 Tax=Paenibacillus allorhizosphaerae TaxID=2849866 RepID=A0ABN7TFM8_9BACL|nr:endospore germination permease [Paenibacillus allorhizosphaerae]CAG7614369.1 Spore germination protein YndE [Paenibacillus allorhizosphaerae]